MGAWRLNQESKATSLHVKGVLDQLLLTFQNMEVIISIYTNLRHYTCNLGTRGSLDDPARSLTSTTFSRLTTYGSVQMARSSVKYCLPVPQNSPGPAMVLALVPMLVSGVEDYREVEEWLSESPPEDH